MEEIFINIEKENAWIRNQFNNKNVVSIKDMFAIIEDLIFENEHLKEKIKELEIEKECCDDYDAYNEFLERKGLL